MDDEQKWQHELDNAVLMRDHYARMLDVAIEYNLKAMHRDMGKRLDYWVTRIEELQDERS